MVSIGYVVCLLLLSGAMGKNKRLLLNDQDAILSQISTLQKELAALKTDVHGCTGGTTYIRWGRKDCPGINGTELIYTGITAGGHFEEKGNGGNILCLPHDPIPYGKTIRPTASDDYAHVNGAEYEFTTGSIATNDDVPCAVCSVQSSSSVLMVPAKNVCPSGWKIQYSGLLVGQFHGHSSREFLCLDGNAQYFEGTRQNRNGLLFYPAVAICGSLPCPPYVNMEHLSCAVCAK